MRILDKIYNEMYLADTPDTEEYRKLRKRAFAIWDEAAEILGPTFSDEVWNNIMALNAYESRCDFKEGFRLGVQLMLEARPLPGEPEAIR